MRGDRGRKKWRESATQAPAEPEEARASRRETKADRRRIKELERELRKKDKALAETAALLVGYSIDLLFALLNRIINAFTAEKSP